MSDHLIWFKSSYSDSEGSNCLEVALDWRKCPQAIHVRDSKLGLQSPPFTVAGAAWIAFLSFARTGSRTS